MPSKSAVNEKTRELIRELQHQDYLEGFHLVGGTGLAIHLKHRNSIDIDLFSNFSFNAVELLEKIQQDFAYQIFSTAENTLKGQIQDINVDLIAHRYTYLQEPEVLDGISVLSVPDIAAMKLNAISISGQRPKDFIDIYYILEDYSVSKIIDFYKTKYRQHSEMHVLKCLVYFDDVDLNNWPVLIKEPDLKWRKVKNKLTTEVKSYLDS